MTSFFGDGHFGDIFPKIAFYLNQVQDILGGKPLGLLLATPEIRRSVLTFKDFHSSPAVESQSVNHSWDGSGGRDRRAVVLLKHNA